MMPVRAYADPKSIAKLGEDIYRQKYQAQYETNHRGKFVAINVRTEDATLADTPDEAVERGRAADSQHGMLHLIRVGFVSAFRIKYAAAYTNGIPRLLRPSGH